MGDEFFKESKDKSSVLKDFISTLEIDNSEETEVEVENVLAPIFVGHFLKGYHAIKRWCLEAKDNPDKMRGLDVWVSDAAGRVPNPGRDKSGTVNINPYMDQMEPIHVVSYLGDALGLAIGFVEFGITSNAYKEIAKDPQTTKRVLRYYQQIRDKMREINKSAKQKFIARRLEKIEKKHAGKLSKEQQVLILKIAYIFLS